MNKEIDVTDDQKAQACVEAFKPLDEAARKVMAEQRHDDGGPAFPFQCQGPTTAPEIYYGMSRLDYFAAHAPPAPDWFEPSSLPSPPVPASHQAIAALPADDPRRVACANWMDDDGEDYGMTPDQRAEVDRYKSDMRDYWAACREHEQRQRAAKHVQWAWFYARQVLAESKRQTGGAA